MQYSIGPKRSPNYTTLLKIVLCILGLTRTDLQFEEGKYDTTDPRSDCIEEMSQAQSLGSSEELLWRSVSCFQKAAVLELGSTNRTEKNDYDSWASICILYCKCNFE